MEPVAARQRLVLLKTLSSVIWLGIGSFQVLLAPVALVMCGYGFAMGIIGCWNLYQAFRGLTVGRRFVAEGGPEVVATYEAHGSTQFAFLAANLFFGGVIGVLGSVFDIYVRNEILRCREVFLPVRAAA